MLDKFTKYKDILIYLVLGAFTTFVNFLVYFPLLNYCSVSAAVANVLAWVAAVLFAFVTNKPFVFKSKDWSIPTLLPEFTKFIGCRLGSGIIETLFIMVTVDVLTWNGNVIKILISVFVVIANYLASKYFVFRK